LAPGSVGKAPEEGGFKCESLFKPLNCKNLSKKGKGQLYRLLLDTGDKVHGFMFSDKGMPDNGFHPDLYYLRNGKNLVKQLVILEDRWVGRETSTLCEFNKKSKPASVRVIRYESK